MGRSICIVTLTFVVVCMVENMAIRTNTSSVSSIPSKRKRFILGLTYLATQEENVYQPEAIDTDLYIPGYTIPNDSTPLLLINFKLGWQQTPQYAIMDTGSKSKWVYCKSDQYNFNGGLQTPDPIINIFEPFNSLSFERLSCSDIECPNKCTDDVAALCIFQNHHGSHQNPEGYFARDFFTFQTYDTGVTRMQAVFSCVSKIDNLQYTSDKRFNGIFGLRDIAFLKYVGNGKAMFSYCIGDLSNPNQTYSNLQMGEDIGMQGLEVRLQYDMTDSYYMVGLRTIFLGGRTDEDLNIEPHTVTIDTGTRNLWIHKEFYFHVMESLKRKVLKLGFTESVVSPRRTCFNGYVTDARLADFIGLTLLFQGGAIMELRAYQLFYQLYTKRNKINVFCIAIELHETETILGIWAQQGYNMAFDVAAKSLFILKVDCETMYH